MTLRAMLILFGTLHASSVALAEPPEITLWPNGMPEPKVQTALPEAIQKPADAIQRRSNVSKPRLVVYEAVEARRTGAAMIVVPGGGFGILADEHEGSEACVWLSKQGITGFLLLHRCPTNKHTEASEGPVQDTQRAVQLVRQQAEKWKIDAKKVGVLGFSAGGQVTLIAATNEPKFAGADELKTSHKPDFLVLAYPYRIYDDKKKSLRADIHINAKTPPTFIAQASDDTASLPQGSTLLFLDLLNNKVPAELHIYETGGHGYGMRPKPNATGPTDWGHRAEDWLRLRGLGAR